jgi:hypothetical protein
MANVFSDAFRNLDQLGLTDIVIPFVLIFAIIYAVLSRIQMFEKKNINVIIALSIALLSIIPHATGAYQEFDVVEVINTSLPQIGLIIIGLVLLMILLGVVNNGDSPGLNSLFLGIAGILGVVMLLVVFWRALFPYSTPNALGFLDNPQTQSLIIIFLVFGLVVYFVTKEGGGDGDDGTAAGLAKLRDGIKTLFGAS